MRAIRLYLISISLSLRDTSCGIDCSQLDHVQCMYVWSTWPGSALASFICSDARDSGEANQVSVSGEHKCP